MHKWHFRPQIP